MSRLVTASLVFALSSPAAAGPKLVVPGGTDLDLGDVAWGETVWREMLLRNEGDELLDVRIGGPG